MYVELVIWPAGSQPILDSSGVVARTVAEPLLDVNTAGTHQSVEPAALLDEGDENLDPSTDDEGSCRNSGSSNRSISKSSSMGSDSDSAEDLPVEPVVVAPVTRDSEVNDSSASVASKQRTYAPANLGSAVPSVVEGCGGS